MPDNLTKQQRSFAMSQVRSQGTGLEIMVRQRLSDAGLSFRTNVGELPGKPDIVFDDARVAVFVDGDFWHGYRFPKWEKSLSEFWRQKIAKTRERDRKTHRKLRRQGWRVVRLWQHDIERNLDGQILKVTRRLDLFR